MEQKKTRNTADFLVECLEEEGVHYIFGIPGEENLAVMDALEHSKIEFITVRHEQGAAFMADVYGRLTGKAGVCMATLGPGATNLITGVADADCDGAPLVAISGQVGTDKMHITAHQYLDLRAMFERLPAGPIPSSARTRWLKSPAWPSNMPNEKNPVRPSSTCQSTSARCPSPTTKSRYSIRRSCRKRLWNRKSKRPLP